MNNKIVKICIFDKHSTPSSVLGNNGDAILDNICINCETDEGLDGNYVLDASFIVDTDGIYKNISDESILKVNMDYGEEIFRIAKIDRTSRDITVFARQITISETLDMWIEDVRPTNTSGLSALSTLRNNSIGKKDIQVFSNITNTATAYYMDMSIYEAIHDTEQSFINRWGGEVQRRCYNLTINDKIGNDRGIQIRSRKNLTGFEANTDIDKVVTRLKVKGFDLLELDEFVDSPLIGKYSSIKTKTVKYDDVKVKDENNPDEGYSTEKEAKEELLRRAKLEFTKNKIDELRAEYIINFVYLEQTEEYKNYIQAERVYIGDVVHVYEEKHDINISVRAIRKRYDVLRQRVIEIELSNTDIKQKTITTSDILAELSSIISKTENNSVSDIVQSMINSGIKDSYVIPRQNELIVADNKDLDKANNLIRINKNGLAFSKNGYYGDYDYGFTIDGVINASLISTGILSTILIQNADGSLQIDLSNNRGIMTKLNGKNAIELAGQVMKFYDWDGVDKIGQLYSTRRGGDEDKPGIALSNAANSYLSLSYEKDNTYYPYATLDKHNISSYSSDESDRAILIHESIDMRSNSLYNTSIVSDNGIAYVNVTDNQVTIAHGDANIILKDGKIYLNGDVKINGTITDKNDNEIVGGGIGGGTGTGWLEGKLSRMGFRFIKGFEGFAPSKYQDSGGYWTIAYGVTAHGEPSIYNQLVSESPITEERGARVSYDLKNSNYGLKILNAVKELGCTEQYQFDALCSLAYNCGTGVVTGSNSLMTAIKNNPKDESTIRSIWEKFYTTSGGIQLPGLVARRKEECNMFFNKSFEVRSISTINSSGNVSGTVTENDGNGWLPEDEVVVDCPKVTTEHGEFSCPTYGTVSASYPYYPSGGNHNGVDIANSSGTPIFAMRSGTVSKSGWYTGGGMETYGNVIYIDHENGLQTRYAHNSKLLVKVGDIVKEGQKIAEMGTTGNSTGNHLHFEVLKNGARTHPATNLKVGDKIEEFTPSREVKVNV